MRNKKKPNKIEKEEKDYLLHQKVKETDRERKCVAMKSGRKKFSEGESRVVER